MLFYIENQSSTSFGCPCGMDTQNDEFIQKNFPDAEQETIFRSSALKDTGARIVGLYLRHNCFNI